MAALIVPIIEAIARVVNITREALAKSLEEMAADIRAGKLIPDDAFEQAKKDQARISVARDTLPD